MTYHQVDDRGAVIPYPGEIPAEAIVAIERADEEQIIKSFAGGFAQENLLYSYEIATKTGKKLIVGVAVDGAKEIARLLGNIEIQPDAKVQEKEDYFYGMIRAKDLLRNVTLAGFARQCKFYLDEHNKPTDRLNEWAYVIALTKAQRNAILSITPQEPLIKVIQEFITQKKMSRLAPPKQPIVPPPGAKAREPEAKPTPAKEVSKTELNKLKASFMISWHEYEGTQVWNKEESEAQRAKWLKERFNKESLTELTPEELAKAKSMLEGDITALLEGSEAPAISPEPPKPVEQKAAQLALEPGDEPASLEERRQVAEQIMSKLKKNKDEVKEIVVQTTGKKKDWTKSDIQKIIKWIEDEEKKVAASAEAEAGDFLSEEIPA